MTGTAASRPLITELDDRTRMLEAALEVGGELHRTGLRQLLDTLRRVRTEMFEGEGIRDAW